MGSLNPADTNPISLFFEHQNLLPSLENLNLNHNNTTLASNSAAACLRSTTSASSSNHLTANNVNTPGRCYPVLSAGWKSWKQYKAQEGSSNMGVGDHNSFYMAGNETEDPRSIGMTSLNRQFNGPWSQDATQHCSCYTRSRNYSVEAAAITRNGSISLQRILKEGNPAFRQEIFEAICGNIFEVMANEYGHHLFQRLLDVCDSTQLNAIFYTLASRQDLFIDVALHRHGSTAVQALIKKLKKSDVGFTMTSILSKRFLELMTGEQGRYVVQQCFNTFKPKENEVLYDAAVLYFKELATSEHGCASLNACLGCIGGAQRAKLLTQISQHSDLLSNDPWGHFVVQHVLMFRDENLTQIICTRLEALYIHLAHTKGGSHVVEKCIRSSDFGMRSVVGVLLKTEKALFQLASDQFGNYAVQTALKVTKQHNVELYRSLVMLLEKRNLLLSRNVIGRHIVNLIRDLESQQC